MQQEAAKYGIQLFRTDWNASVTALVGSHSPIFLTPDTWRLNLFFALIISQIFGQFVLAAVVTNGNARLDL
jgi:hypothetical protein